MQQALEGIKILDFSRFLPGPYCTGMLADFGADVIRVEEPGFGLWGGEAGGRRGEDARGVTRRHMANVDIAKVRAYDCAGRNKRSIVLDLKSEQGRQIVYKLAQWADVVVEEYRPGVPKRLGIDYETLKGINPRLVYCSITLFGQDGPYRDRPGHDPCALGVAGLLAAPSPHEPPWGMPVPLGDILSGSHAVIGILTALRARDLTRRGQHVDISMTDSVLTTLTLRSQSFFQGRPERRGRRVRTPWTGIFETQDRKYLVVTNVEAHHWANFCRAISREDMIDQFLNRETREQLHDEVKELFLTRTQQEWLELFSKYDTQVAPANQSLEEVFSDPQVRHRKMVIEVDHPTLGKVKQLGFPIKLSDMPQSIRRLASAPGEQTDEILNELGYSAAQIAEMREAGAIR